MLPIELGGRYLDDLCIVSVYVYVGEGKFTPKPDNDLGPLEVVCFQRCTKRVC